MITDQRPGARSGSYEKSPAWLPPDGALCHSQYDTMSNTQPRRGSYTLRFARLGGQIIAYTRVRKHIGGQGQGKHRRVRLFSTRERPIADVKPKTFQSMVQGGLIRRLQLPHSLKTKAEDLSDRIGEEYTPQEALALLQQKLQDHATTLETDIATSPAPVGEGIAHG